MYTVSVYWIIISVFFLSPVLEFQQIILTFTKHKNTLKFRHYQQLLYFSIITYFLSHQVASCIFKEVDRSMNLNMQQQEGDLIRISVYLSGVKNTYISVSALASVILFYM